ncbi:hypothetical protein CPS_4072 [Colwellia psychrerythraea 34H]|uniref:Uncharacterized protein n=1 Tax=Colwellia psychrerythraea (strain 34H / ATCC BAA-681) TaxID=167879 RepID=Q47WU5_COLP3|nr:hypothetical protein CPS_4072 [Colwellia psychrerythraea 34H]
MGWLPFDHFNWASEYLTLMKFYKLSDGKTN